MTQHICHILLFLFLVCACTKSPLLPPLIKGGRGDYNPARIISLKPNITEILFALGVGDRVVGVTTWCDWPPEARNLPKIADYVSINIERIIQLKPDLVIGSEENSLRRPIESLERAGVKTLLVPFGTLRDLYAGIETIAKAVGRVEEGERLVERLRGEFLDLKSKRHEAGSMKQEGSRGGAEPRRMAGPSPPNLGGHGGPPLHSSASPEPRILILVGHRPLVAAGPSTFYGELLELIGGENIITAGAIPYPTIDIEIIVARAPDVIIDMGMGSEAGLDLPAVFRGRIVRFDVSEFRAGPRLGEAVKKLASAIMTNDKIYKVQNPKFK